MDDAVLVRFFEPLRDLPRDGDGLVNRKRTAGEALREVFAKDEFHHQRDGGSCRGGPLCPPARGVPKGAHEGRPYVLQSVNRRDVRMVQGREGLCFAPEPCDSFVIIRERRG